MTGKPAELVVRYLDAWDSKDTAKIPAVCDSGPLKVTSASRHVTQLLARIAACVALVQGLAHGAMFITARPHSLAETAVAAAMWSVRFRLGGALHSYGEMYFGYGLMAAASCLFEAALLWFIAPLARDNPAAFRRLAAVILAANLVHAALVVRYFFLLPLVMDGLVSAFVLASLLTSHGLAKPAPSALRSDRQNTVLL